MAQADIGLILNRLPVARPATVPCTVQAAHATLVARLLLARPFRIDVFVSDRSDIQNRAEHLRDVLDAVVDYVKVIVEDTAENAPGGSVDAKYIVGCVTDLAAESAGALAFVADDDSHWRV